MSRSPGHIVSPAPPSETRRPTGKRLARPRGATEPRAIEPPTLHVFPWARRSPSRNLDRKSPRSECETRQLKDHRGPFPQPNREESSPFVSKSEYRIRPDPG